MFRPALVVALLVSAAALLWSEAKVYPYRWVLIRNRLANDASLEQVAGVIRTAASHRLNGAVIGAAGLDSLDRQPADRLERIRQVKQMCDRDKVEFIPTGFSAGYGGSITSSDPNLAEGLKVENALFVAGVGEARFVPDSPEGLRNGGFEEAEGHRIAAFESQDGPGETTFVDHSMVRTGKASLRAENFAASQRGVRLVQEVAVRPNRCYRFEAWVRTEDVPRGSNLNIRAFAPDGRDLAYFQQELSAPGEWRRYTGAFNSWYADKVRFTLHVAARGGRVWVDDVRIEETALQNILRRAGTPLRVRNERTGQAYEEGRDFGPLTDPKLDFRWDRPAPPLRLTSNSRIRKGDRLRVDFYHGMRIYSGQVVICMAEPKVYELWSAAIAAVEKHLAPKKYVLSMDEVRIANRCETCRARKLSPAALVGDSVTRLYKMIRERNPSAEVWVWSDMFDPNHNARDRYYLVEGDYTGSWNYLPKDMGILCWYYQRRRLSLDHFSKLGFRTMAGAYYDADDLENPKAWLEALDQTPGAMGIMYTTWENKYDLLADFGDLVSKR